MQITYVMHAIKFFQRNLKINFQKRNLMRNKTFENF